jgi:TupA-like ATPgrasp
MGRQFLKFICRMVEVIVPTYVAIVRNHYYRHGHIRFFIFPKTFNELIQSNKIFKRSHLIVITSDKWRVRQYVKEKIGERYLIPLRTVVENPQSIDFNSLPDSFVVKANHGSGFNFLVAEKKTADRAKVDEALAAWLKIDFAAYHGEWAYRNIKRRVLVEDMLVQDGKIPNDYKFFVFNGRVRMIQLSQGRHTSSYRKNLYDEQWRQLAVEYGAPCSLEPLQPPAQLPQMIGLAEVLGRDFNFARIDLYLIDGKIFFGEVTHYPNAGLVEFKPQEFDRVLGDVWRKDTPIPSKYYVPRLNACADPQGLPITGSAIPVSSVSHPGRGRSVDHAPTLEPPPPLRAVQVNGSDSISKTVDCVPGAKMSGQKPSWK